MQRLNAQDGSDKYLKAANYHIRFCRQRKSEPLFASLQQEMEKKRDDLKTTLSKIETKEQQVDDLGADAAYIELNLEDAVRDLDAELGMLDRQNPSLGAQGKVFPNGFSPVIAAEEEAQLTELSSLKVRLAPFATLAALSPVIARLDVGAAALDGALTQLRGAEKELSDLEDQEREGRREIREQLEDANGKLRSYFKARPTLAERFFLKDKPSGARKEAQLKVEAKATAEAVLTVLGARSLAVSDELRKKIQETRELEVLKRWLARAATVSAAAEILAVS